MILFEDPSQDDVNYQVHNRFFGRKFAGPNITNRLSNNQKYIEQQKNNSINNDKNYTNQLILNDQIPTEIRNGTCIVNKQLKGWKLTSEAKKKYIMDMVVDSYRQLGGIPEEVSADMSFDHQNSIELRRELALMHSIRRIGNVRISKGFGLKSKEDIYREAMQTFDEQNNLINGNSNEDNPTTPTTHPRNGSARSPSQRQSSAIPPMVPPSSASHTQLTPELESRAKYSDAIKYFSKLARGDVSPQVPSNTHHIHNKHNNLTVKEHSNRSKNAHINKTNQTDARNYVHGNAYGGTRESNGVREENSLDAYEKFVENNLEIQKIKKVILAEVRILISYSIFF